MDDQEVSRLKDELQELRAELEQLRAEVSRNDPSHGDSMRSQLTCPKCKGRSILHVERLRDHNYGNNHTHMAIQENIAGLFRKKWTGAFEVYVCRACEYAEWYVTGAGDIEPEKLDRQNRKYVRIIDGEPSESAPYR